MVVPHLLFQVPCFIRTCLGSADSYNFFLHNLYLSKPKQMNRLLNQRQLSLTMASSKSPPEEETLEVSDKLDSIFCLKILRLSFQKNTFKFNGFPVLPLWGN